MIRDMFFCIESRFGQAQPYQRQWLSDNGPACDKKTLYFGRTLGLERCTTVPYSPQSKGIAEAFVKTFKKDYAYIPALSSERKGMKQLNEWFKDYNNHAPHKGLKMLFPRKYGESSQKDLMPFKGNLAVQKNCPAFMGGPPGII